MSELMYDKATLLSLRQTYSSLPTDFQGDAIITHTVPLVPVNSVPRSGIERRYRDDPCYHRPGAVGSLKNIQQRPMVAPQHQQHQQHPQHSAQQLKRDNKAQAKPQQAPAATAVAAGFRAQQQQNQLGRPGSAQGMWKYLDPQGALQGPFPENKMRIWFESGYFALTLPILAPNETELIPLGTLIAAGKAPFAVPLPPAASPAAGGSPRTGQKTTNAAGQDIWSGGSSTSQLDMATISAQANMFDILRGHTAQQLIQQQVLAGSGLAGGPQSPHSTPSTTINQLLWGGAVPGAGLSDPSHPSHQQQQQQQNSSIASDSAILGVIHNQQQQQLHGHKQGHGQQQQHQQQHGSKAGPPHLFPGAAAAAQAQAGPAAGSSAQKAARSALPQAQSISSWSADGSPGAPLSLYAIQQEQELLRKKAAQGALGSPSTFLASPTLPSPMLRQNPTLSEILAGEAIKAARIEAEVSPLTIAKDSADLDSARRSKLGGSGGQPAGARWGESAAQQQGQQGQGGNNSNNKPSLRDIQRAELERVQQQQEGGANGNSKGKKDQSGKGAAGGLSWSSSKISNTESNPTASPGISRPSLLDIQREEEARMAKLKVLEAQNKKTQAASNAGASQGPWKSSAGSRPKSLSEIQEEELRHISAAESSSGGHVTTTSGGGLSYASKVSAHASGFAVSSASSKSAAPAAAPAASAVPSGPAAGGNSDLFWDYPAIGSNGSSARPAGQTSSQQELETWCVDRIRTLTSKNDITLVHFLIAHKDHDEIRKNVLEYLGDTKQTKAFAEEFIERLSAVNKSNSSSNSNSNAASGGSGGGGGGGGGGKGGKKKK